MILMLPSGPKIYDYVLLERKHGSEHGCYFSTEKKEWVKYDLLI